MKINALQHIHESPAQTYAEMKQDTKTPLQYEAIYILFRAVYVYKKKKNKEMTPRLSESRTKGL